MLEDLFKEQRKYLNYFFDHIDLQQVEKLIEILYNCSGEIFFTGIGKSGIIAEKIAVTMVSTGTRSLFLTSVNILHGDLGIVTAKDIVILISKSGETDELLHLIPYIRNKGAFIIALASEKNSRLAKACDKSIYLPVQRELCPFDLAPTTSTVVQLIFGDILAVALMKKKNFSIEDYAENHPAGRIGKRITLKVKDLMISGEVLPTCSPDDKLIDMLVELSNKRCGCLLLIDKSNHLLGIFTDGDLRRALQNQGVDVLNQPIKGLATKQPKTISPEAMATEAMKLMEADQKSPVTVLPVLDETDQVMGLIKMHDILQSGL